MKRKRSTLDGHPKPDVIRSGREAVGLTQTEAAAIIFCNLRSWQQWEAGERRMHPAFWQLWKMKIEARVRGGEVLEPKPVKRR